MTDHQGKPQARADVAVFGEWIEQPTAVELVGRRKAALWWGTEVAGFEEVET